MQVRVRLEVREDELARPKLAVDPARVDAVLRPHLEHAGTAEPLDVEDAPERIRNEREIGKVVGARRRPVVSDRTRVLDVLGELAEPR